LLAYFGIQWDVSWHIVIGRESAWIPPHLAVYSGVGLVLASGVVPLWLTRGRASPGVYLLAIAGLASTFAAPLDELWHRLYGLDSTIWSFPHLVFVFSGSLVPLALIRLLHEQQSTVVSPGQKGSRFMLSWSPEALLRDRSLLLCGFFLAWLDISLIEFRFHVPPPYWTWSFALFPPLMASIALLASCIGVAVSGRAGAFTIVCAVFTVLAIAANDLIWIGYSVFQHEPSRPIYLEIDPPLQTVPLLLVSAIAADLLWSRLTRLPWVARLIIASLAFTALFYAVQFPYTQFARPPWPLRLISEGWQLALLLPPVSAAVGLLLGSGLLLAPRPAWEPRPRRQVSPA
jgi:hypothetical protein